MSSHPHHHFAIATALRQTFAEGYGWARFRKDLLAAFIVSLVALPLSMALAIAVGLPPQHGLYTAIVAGIVAPLLGGAKLQVSGPTAAFVAVLAPIVATHGLHGLIWCQLLAGLFLLVFALTRLGRFIAYVPYTVVTGFTAGIAVILGVISLNDLLGMNLTLSGHFHEKLMTLIRNADAINPYTAVVGFITLALIAQGSKLVRFVPSTILALICAITLSMVFAYFGHPVETIASKFSYLTHEGQTAAGIPSYPPTLHFFAWPTLEQWGSYLYPALIIALLAGLESLLSAIISDTMIKTHQHNPNAELWGIGFGNLVSGLFAGIPATGALARTAALINSGGTSPIASAMHAVFILLYMVSLAPAIGHIPMPALAAILIHTAYRMSHWRECVRVLRWSPKSQAVILLTAFGLTVAIDMIAGITGGLVMAGAVKLYESSKANKQRHLQE